MGQWACSRSQKEGTKFFFFLSSSGTRLIIHKHHWLCKGFCLGVLQALLSAVTSANDLFLRPTPPPLDS